MKIKGIGRKGVYRLEGLKVGMLRIGQQNRAQKTDSVGLKRWRGWASMYIRILCYLYVLHPLNYKSFNCYRMARLRSGQIEGRVWDWEKGKAKSPTLADPARVGHPESFL